MEIPVGLYREVFLEQPFPGNWKEITVDTGTTQTTLQDIKATELAGSYAYKNANHPATKNRFISWRTSQDCLELVELSLDAPLVGNLLRYRFTNAPLLSGLTVHEASEHLVVLVVTISSVHCLTFTHPAVNYRKHFYGEMTPSTFMYASVSAIKDPNSFHVINRPHNAAIPTCGASWLSADGDVATFALSGMTEAVTVIRLNVATGHVQEAFLNEPSSIVPKFLVSFAQILRGKREPIPTADLILFNCDGQTMLVSLGVDGNLRYAIIDAAPTSTHLLELISAPVEGPGFQPHMIRLCTGLDGAPMLVVHLCFESDSTFYLLEPVISGRNSVDFQLFATIPATDFVTAQTDLVDVCIADGKLVGAWRGPDGASFVANTLLGYECDWVCARMENVTRLYDDTIRVEHPLGDQQLLFLEQIFTPGRFTIPVITRALNVFQHSMCAVAAGSMSLSALSRAACLAVHLEATRGLPDDVTVEEFLENTHTSWVAFRSCVLQCHLAGDRPAAITPLSNGLVLVKKHRISLLRHMDAIEGPTVTDSLPNILRDLAAMIPKETWQMFDMHSEDATTHFKNFVPLHNRLDESDEDEVANPAERKPIKEKVSSQFKIAFTLAIQLRDNEDDVLEILGELVDRANNLPDWPEAFTDLLNALIPELGECKEPRDPVALASHLGNSVVAITLQQIIDNRLMMCRSLLLLKCVLKAEAGVHVALLEEIVLKVDRVAQTYAALKSLCAMTAQRGTVSVAELLVSRIPEQERRGSDLFGRVRQMLCLIWPHGACARIGQILLQAGELNTLVSWEDCIALWCPHNVGRRHAQVGRAWLRMNRPAFAADYFISAAGYVPMEPEVLNIVGCRPTQPEKAVAMYYLKVMDLLDKQDFRCETARIALDALDKLCVDDPMVPIFHSRLFSRAMALQHYDEAFAAVRSNPDPCRRVDSLRELVLTLVRSRQTEVLFTFTYNDLFPALERILERSARATDPSLMGAYGVLYSLYLRRGDHRKAAAYVLEVVFRMNREMKPTLKLLRQQKNCLLICIVSMRMVQPKYQWLASQEYKKEEYEEDMAYENAKLNEEEEVSSPLVVHEMLATELAAKPFLVTIVSVKDLKRQLAMVKARILLLKMQHGESRQHLLEFSPVEMVAVLTSCRYFCDALNIAALFDLSCLRPLEGLASANVELQRLPDADPWEWLQNNFTPETGDCEMNASNTAWRLLQVLLLRYEKPNVTELHLGVVARLMQEAFHPPHFLVTYFRMNNPAELLRAYLSAGWLEEAVQHAQKYVTSVSGGFPDFGMSEKLVTGEPTCLPWRTLHTLLQELDRPHFQEHRKSLAEDINHYLEVAQRAALQLSVGLTT